jgi:hypothetical protein
MGKKADDGNRTSELEKEYISSMVVCSGNETMALEKMEEKGVITKDDIRDHHDRTLNSECWQSEMPAYHRDTIASENQDRRDAFLSKYGDSRQREELMRSSPEAVRRDLDHLSPAFMRVKYEEEKRTRK